MRFDISDEEWAVIEPLLPPSRPRIRLAVTGRHPEPWLLIRRGVKMDEKPVLKGTTMR
jgi:transposase